MKVLEEGQYVDAKIDEISMLCKIEKINANDVTVSDGNHLHDVNFESVSSARFATTSEVEKPEMVDHPDHYLPGTYEAIKVIEAWLGKKACFDFCIANSLKYIARMGRKKDSSLDIEAKKLEDLKKASWYLKYALELKIKKEEN